MDCRIAIIIAIICGLIFDYSVSMYQCLALLVFPVACALKRRAALSTISIFYAVAAMPVIWVVYSYTDSWYWSLVQYMLLVLLNCSVVGLAVVQTRVPTAIAIPLALLAVSVPPLSFVNPISVLPLAGWLFPGFGSIGLVGLLVLIAIITSAKRYAVFALAAVLAASIPLSNSYAFTEVKTISAIDLVRAHDERLNASVMRTAYRHEELDLITNQNSDSIVLPESVFGVWDPSVGDILSHSDASVYGGARVYIDAKHYLNVIVNAKTGEVIYEQRNPPPLSTKNTAKAVSGIGEKRDVGISWLVCYELSNSWLAFKAFSDASRPVVWVSNLSWFESTYLSNRMNSVLDAWSRLYGQTPYSSVMSHD